MRQGKKTVVLGASNNPARYSYLAVKRLLAHQHPVVAIGKRKGAIDGIEIETDHVPVGDVDTITLYLNPMNQQEYYDYIFDLKPRRIIFNPGTENDTLIQRCEENGIEPVIACTLVMLSTGQY
jgi:uncharacterized protein